MTNLEQYLVMDKKRRSIRLAREAQRKEDKRLIYEMNKLWYKLTDVERDKLDKVWPRPW